MSKELFVSSTPHETKVAIVEEDLLTEVYFERENEYTLAGSIYKGRVTRVLPGMQSAFVSIGLDRDAFLYVSDFLLEEEEDADGADVAVAVKGAVFRSVNPVRNMGRGPNNANPGRLKANLAPSANSVPSAPSVSIIRFSPLMICSIKPRGMKCDMRQPDLNPLPVSHLYCCPGSLYQNINLVQRSRDRHTPP